VWTLEITTHEEEKDFTFIKKKDTLSSAAKSAPLGKDPYPFSDNNNKHVKDYS
jgi:hypothetical protein